MRFSITHEFKYTYDSPVRLSTQYLRLTPRDTARQKVTGWNLETPGPALRTTDGYGNVLHVLTLDKAVSEISIEAAGAVETSPALDEPLGAFAAKYRRAIPEHSGLRELAAAIHDKHRGGSAADAVHAFIACCRHLGVPARYVSGYMYARQKDNNGVAMHAWAEAWVVERWRSFDIAHDSPVGEAHIKLAVGADYLDACPVRGVRIGGGAETLLANAHVEATQQ